MDYWTRKYNSPPSTASNSQINRSVLKTLLKGKCSSTHTSIDNKVSITSPPKINVKSPEPAKAFIDMNQLSTAVEDFKPKRLRVKSLNEVEEKVLIKSYWRQLAKW